MSKNFELLQQIEKEHELFQAPREAAAPPAALPSISSLRSGRNGHRPLRLEDRTREEAIKLVQRVFLAGNSGPRVVAFAGVDRENGCSSVCVCAAEALRNLTPEAVCVVDANLRSPSLHNYFGISRAPGLVEAMTQAEPVRGFAHQVPASNVWVMPCGTAEATSHLLLNSERLRSCMAELRTEFEYVLVDTAAVNVYTDALAVGQAVDGMILVLQSEATRRETARRAKEAITTADVRLLGAVLNKRTYPIPQALYERL